MSSSPIAARSAPPWVTETVLSVGVLVVVEAEAITWVSPSVSGLLGWTASQLLGRPVASLVHPADAMLVDPPSPSTGPPRRFKRRRLLCSDGEYRWVEGVVLGQHAGDNGRPATLLRLHDASNDRHADRSDRSDTLDEAADWRWLPAALDASPDGFAIFRVHRRGPEPATEQSITLQMINKVGATAYQIDPPLLRGRSLEEMAPPEVAIPLRDLVTRSSAGPGLHRRRIVVELPGWESILDVVAARLDPTRVVVTWRDISTQVQAEGVLMDAYARAQTAWDLLHDILASLPDPVLLVDGSDARSDGHDHRPPAATSDSPLGQHGPTCVFINQAAAGFLDIDESHAAGAPLEHVLPASCRSELLTLVATVARSRQRHQARLTTRAPADSGGEPPQDVVMLVTASPTAGGRIAVICRDVTADERERQRLQQQRNSAEQAARRDPLTGLRNRLGLETALNQILLSCPPDRHVIVIVIDLAIETVNATLGLPRGDRLLKDTAKALTDAVPDAAAVARLGSGEFVIILADRRPGWTVGSVFDAVRTGIDSCWPHDQIDVLVHYAHYCADPAARSSDRDGSDVLNAAITDVRSRWRDHGSP